MPTIKLKPTTTRPAFTPYAPFVQGEYPTAFHTFHDFDIPPTFALVSPVNQYGMRFARIYIPNPWVPDEIRYYDWIMGDAGIWSRSMGSHFRNLETARMDWKKTKAQGWTPQDVIANPLNGENDTPTWDRWAYHFCSQSFGFYSILRIYKNTYPRKAV